MEIKMPIFFSDYQIEKYEEIVDRLATDTTTEQYSKSLADLLVIIQKANKKIEKYTYTKSDRWLESERGQCFVDNYECEWIDHEAGVKELLDNVHQIIGTELKTGFNDGVKFMFKDESQNFIFGYPDFEFDY